MTRGVTSGQIAGVADTAFLIAAYRAQETESSAPAFRDPFAAKLAGKRGREIAASIPHTEAMAFAMIVRTAAIDRLIELAVSGGVEMVINLGAGLDTRPYRMQLPAALRWVEIDFAETLRYKESLLQSEKPTCHVERVALDLSDTTKRREILSAFGCATKSAVILTEGLIGYLSNDEARALSQDLISFPSFRYWIQDYSRGRLRNNRHSRKISKHFVSAPWKFAVNDPLEFFQQDGWSIHTDFHILDEADRIGKRFPALFPWNVLLRIFPNTIKRLGNRTHGYVMFARS